MFTPRLIEGAKKGHQMSVKRFINSIQSQRMFVQDIKIKYPRVYLMDFPERVAEKYNK